MSGLFKSKKTELPSPRQISSPQQTKAYDYLQNLMQQGQLYTGQRTAAPQSYEGYLPGLVEGYVNRQPSSLYTQAQQELSKTLTGDYDPYTSEYYKAYRDQSQANLEEAQTQARQSANIGGMLRSTGRLNTENKLIGATTRDLNSILAGMYEGERMKRLGAVPQAFELERYEEGAPLRSMEAIMGAGSYQTAQQQAELDRMYQDYLNSIGMQYNAAGLLASPGTYNYYQPQYSTDPSMFSQYGMPLIQAYMQGGYNLPFGAGKG